MAKKVQFRTITAGDIKRRHPRSLTFRTDTQYADLANDIYDLTNDDLSFMEATEKKNTCISLALFFEDLHSGTHMFETFTSLYHRMYGMYLPFYNSTDASQPSARFDAMRFMLWHSICAERNGRVLNPTNDMLKVLADKLLRLWDEKKTTIEPNEELADYLYAEETQQAAHEVKRVMVWLSLRFPLGRWFTNPDVSNDVNGLRDYFPTLDKDTLEYANECSEVFEMQTWPLSLAPQRIYAEMIRLEMNDPNDEMAAAIEHIQYKPFAIYQVISCDSEQVCLQDFMGDTFRVDRSEFTLANLKAIQKYPHFFGSFISLGDNWELNGAGSSLKLSQKKFDKYLEEERRSYHAMHDYVGQFDNYISAHGGERLYFFRNSRQYMEWGRKDLKLAFPASSLPFDDNSQPLIAFYEDNGQFTLSQVAELIKHPNNPYYDPIKATDYAFELFSQHGCSPGMMLHLLQHDLLPDAALNDLRGREHGRLLLQDNIEFVARCMRRDIKSDTVVRPRRVDSEPESEAHPAAPISDKLPYERFVEVLAAEKSIRSKANKEWKVVRANPTTTVIRDVTRRLDFNIPTRSLYEAHLQLKSNEIQVANVIPFVGRENAPAASALLYNVVGEGQSKNHMRKLSREILRLMKM